MAPSHWTYAVPDRPTELEQGDILRPTADLQALLRDIHPYFVRPQYTGFLVATQSCDLALHSRRPKAPHVTLAAIRPLRQAILSRLAAQVAEEVRPNTFRRGSKAEVRQLLMRLVNQNEQAIGAFFLHPDADCGIAEPSVAMLRVTVSLKADHYDRLLAARVGTLESAFRAKLGWLLGNLYARPATSDWTDQSPEARGAIEQLLGKLLDSDLQWLDDEIVAEAKKRGLELPALSVPDLEALRPQPALEAALDAVESEARKVLSAARRVRDQELGPPPELDALLAKLRNRLRNSGPFKRLVRYPPTGPR